MAEIVWSSSSIKDINAIAECIAKDSLIAAKNVVELFLKIRNIITLHTPWKTISGNKKFIFKRNFSR